MSTQQLRRGCAHNIGCGREALQGAFDLQVTLRRMWFRAESTTLIWRNEFLEKRLRGFVAEIPLFPYRRARSVVSKAVPGIHAYGPCG